MKKTLLLLGSILLLIASNVSCDKDEANPSDFDSADRIIGTWNVVKVTYLDGDFEEFVSDDCNDYFWTFQKDGIFNSFFQEDCEVDKETGSYLVNNNVNITIIIEDEDDEIRVPGTFTIIGDQMTITVTDEDHGINQIYLER